MPLLFRENRGPVGCLLIGRTEHMSALRDHLAARGVDTVVASAEGDLLSAAQEGLRSARRAGGACVAAEGELWAAALALAVQLSVERVVLIAPTDRFQTPRSERERQVERLKGFVRRNLFFCVSEVLVLEAEEDVRSDRRVDLICRRMCNARVHRLPMEEGRWRNGEHSLVDAAAAFLQRGDSAFALAK